MARPEQSLLQASAFDFTRSDADMAELGALDEGTHYAWDPASVP